MSSRADLVGALTALVRTLTYADSIATVRGGAAFENAQAVAEGAAKGNIAPLPWTPFVQAVHVRPTEAQIASVAKGSGFTLDQVREQFARSEAEDTLFVNSRYQVSVRDTGEMRHLSIKRIDQAPVHDWRDLQRIKDELVGPECEGIEIYPAQSRLVDTATQYHLWCVRDPAYRFPFGFTERLVSDDSGSHAQRRQEP